jgi:ribose-phosphate pyrophosphokinase
MITIKTAQDVIEVRPTIFPDGTSQVWKLGIDKYANQTVDILWEYETERELIWLIQLLHLLRNSRITVNELYIPYLPYARQDKMVCDDLTFARYTFDKILVENAQNVNQITTLDIHSPLPGFDSKSPKKFIEEAIIHAKADVIVFPDNGARLRYQDKTMDFPYLVLDKDRDQTTGVIKGLKLKDDCEETKSTLFKINVSSRPVNFLIVDDICDGGMTFIKAAELLKTLHPVINIDLYVTHGIYSRGVLPLHNAGIRTNYTTRSLIKYRTNFGLGEFGSNLPL